MNGGVSTSQSTHAAQREAGFATRNRTVRNTTCEMCGEPLTRRQKRYCTVRCTRAARAPRPGRYSVPAIITECRTKYAAAMAVYVTGGGAE